MEAVNLILRFLQLIFVTIILGLSGALVAGQRVGHNDITDYILFCGAWGMLVTFAGLSSAVVKSLRGVVMATLDGLTTLFYLAGSIALAAKLGVHSCSSVSMFGERIPTYYQAYNDIINAGLTLPLQHDRSGSISYQYDLTIPYSRRCRMAQADTAFMFFALAAFAGSTVVSLLSSRK